MSRKHRQSPPASGSISAPSPFASLAALRGALPSGPELPTPIAARQSTFADKVVVRRERSGRGGKTVTIVQGVILEGEALGALVRDLRKGLGTSGHVENGEIVLGGDLSERVVAWLERAGANRVIAGN